MLWSLYWLYPYALVATCALALVGGKVRNIVSVAAIVFDWLILTFVGDQMTLLLNAACDITAAELCLIVMRGRFSQLLMLTWASMILTHAIAGISHLEGVTYWRILSALSWTQLLICFVWSGWNGGNRVKLRLGFYRHLRVAGRECTAVSADRTSDHERGPARGQLSNGG